MGCLLPILMVPVSFAALATMALLFSAIPDPGSPVTAANAARLKTGMTYGQVVAIVGDPAPPPFDGEDQATFCRDGSDTCSWSRCPLCDAQLFLTFERGALVAKRSQGL
ncbi:MAG: hypothetical protein ACKO0M_16040 [Cyanobium sp.]